MFFLFIERLEGSSLCPQLLTGLGAARIKQTQRNTLHIKPSRSSRQYSPHNKLSQMIYAGRHIPYSTGEGCVFFSPLTLILVTTAYFSAYNVDHLLFICATVNDFALSAFRMTIKEHVFSLYLRF